MIELTPLQNCYPGARVDSPVPIYELAIPEVYKDWTWSTNYPDWRELQAYFDHMDKVLELALLLSAVGVEKLDEFRHFADRAGRYSGCARP
jgi:hypothetical protein